MKRIPSIPCALARLAPPSPTSAEELRALRAAAWHKQGIVVIPLDEIYDEWERRFLAALAAKLYGAHGCDPTGPPVAGGRGDRPRRR